MQPDSRHLRIIPAYRRCFLGLRFMLLSTSISSATWAQYGYTGSYLPPKIIEQPQSQVAEHGQRVVFSVKLDHHKDNTYYSDHEKRSAFQWMKNGTRIHSATTDTLTLPNVQLSDAGNYSVVLWDNVVSQTATLTVYIPVPATILTPPVGTTVDAGRAATLSVTASGMPAPTFRWRKNGAPIAGATTSTLTFPDAQPVDEGTYDVLVTNTRNSIFSRAVQLRVIVANQLGTVVPEHSTPALVGSAPSIAIHRLTPGENVTLISPAGAARGSYFWKRNGVALPGGTHDRLLITSATIADMGLYSVLASDAGNAVETLVAVVTVASAGPSRLANLSTRGFIEAGHALTPGFSLSGAGSTPLLVRAIGPTLTRFGVAGALTDPTLEIFAAGSTRPMLANDNWATSLNALDVNSTTVSVGAFALDTFTKDAAVVAAFASDRSYTTRIAASDAASAGVVLAEVYDPASAGHPVRLTSVSTLGQAGSGDRALVSGFSIAGTAPKRLLIRAVGPGLAAFGVPDPLADPQLQLVPAGFHSAIAANDTWQGDAAIAATAKAAGAFPLDPASRDAVVEVTLPPGGYTVTVSGHDGTAGTALVEIYDLDR